ncbi:pyruvate flavodoxin/ferredoxin oxidoreductase domain protein [Methylocella silvestris BL2]|uniref:Pyruvate-flavodoxin oxidoreductase n=1 Tax=Methylocella silvestris (strain DSM 15510 / CIP 108128 / LMG 27833 / NCIMB 13906 / BL2) TaxID=395965 RepID=B8EIT1_METSB|nr:pyruvate:ferredoxin (flavodoxin) oxidoreductase [Methylocella silvestris]ACK51898.1 pyruvate flavodoxin/ferredoxin oxidoreductase domain protein [Methylocella silvestris BL2]
MNVAVTQQTAIDKAATQKTATMDGNTAVAYIAYRVNEVCAIYPITPSSTMAELADEWASAGVRNIWGDIPVVQEMQSEGGAAGAVHGALQSGALTTTFTSSQGLLLMIPNMYKIAGELTATVFNVAARSVATQALSIFGDHSDVMGVRATGFALLSSGSVQEAHDLALIAQAATLESRVPFLHFFDGFRTSHELNKLTLLSDDEIRMMVRDDLVRAHRARALTPERPVMRGTAQNPDTFFQSRETVNPFYARTPSIVEKAMADFANITGRSYRLFEYDGAPDAEHVVVLIGSAAETARDAAAVLNRTDGRRKRGVLQVRLYRPFSADHFLSALPDTTRSIAVLERTKEPGATGEPLYLDVVATLAHAVGAGRRAIMPRMIGGRYGLSSKDFTPAMVKAVFDELENPSPRNSFTVGITDDVSGTSLDVDQGFMIEPDEVVRAVFYGLGSDGTVGANKSSVKILAEDADRYAQGYFVYDSHKSGAQTVSHLRFGPRPIRAPYLIAAASFVACHQFVFLDRIDVLSLAAPGATFLLNCPYDADKAWDRLPRSVQQEIIDKRLRFFVIDASKVARDTGLGGRINTVLQTCFFAISGVLPRDEAVQRIKHMIEESYGEKGGDVVAKNFEAVDHTLAHLSEVAVPTSASSAFERPPIVSASAPAFVQNFTAAVMAGRGDALPVSAMPIDGTFPLGTAAWEKRNIADEVPIWETDLCIQCGQCSIACPHSVIRARFYDEARLADPNEPAPPTFKSAPVNARGYPDSRFTLQFYVEDCTGCGICVEVCPAHSPSRPGTKAINMGPKAPLLEAERSNIAFFESLPENNRALVDFANVRGIQFLEPLFEFSGACGGCGETPYLRLLSQLFGDRLQIANATGCSSIYGGNLPVTPWAANREGRGPAWSNSLFEDNAEFGLGFRLAADMHSAMAAKMLRDLAPTLGQQLVDAILEAPQIRESEILAQRSRVAELKRRLAEMGEDPRALDLLSVLDHLVRRSIWLVGGDGWAYDIGYGGLDHVLASDRDVNVLVLDTEVYSNTGGQASKATPLGAVAKFAAAGKRVGRKDLALQAIAYGNVYVAQVAMGANPQQTLLAFREAEAWPGPSLILAYSHCIAHGFDLRHGMRQQDLAAASGYWPLFRFNPAMRNADEAPFRLDSPRPTIPLKDYAYNELRYRSLANIRPREAAELLAHAQTAATEKYAQYEALASRDGSRFHPDVSALGAEKS